MFFFLFMSHECFGEMSDCSELSTGRSYRTRDGTVYPVHATHEGRCYFWKKGRRRYVRVGGANGCPRESDALTHVYIPHLVQGIQSARTMRELRHGLSSLWLLARLNKCLYEHAVTELSPVIRSYSEELQRVSVQTVASHAGIEFLAYLSGRHRLHDEIRIEVRFVMSDEVKIIANSVIDTNDYAVVSLEMQSVKISESGPRVEYVLNRSRNVYEYQHNNVTFSDAGAPIRVLSETSDTLLGRLLRAHRVVTAHLFPLVEHVYSRRVAENPATVRKIITKGATMRVDNFVSTDILEEEHVFFR